MIFSQSAFECAQIPARSLSEVAFFEAPERAAPVISSQRNSAKTPHAQRRPMVKCPGHIRNGSRNKRARVVKLLFACQIR